MRKYLAPATVVTAALTVFLAGIAVAQSGALAGLAQPVIINIEQLVPVDVTLAIPQDDGSVITTTAPLTVGVSLQIKIDGNHVVAVAPAAEAEPAEVAVATEEPAPAAEDEETGGLVDLSGIPYEVRATDGIVIKQVRSKAVLSMTQLIGEIENQTDEPLKYLTMSINFYDANGDLLDLGMGVATSDTIEPGGESGFQATANVDLNDVASYVIEVQ
jgi:hypothetical protein